MKTDTLFHEFFQLAPQALFELLQIIPGCPYRFESLVVKASERRLDGLLEPAEPQYPRYFVEVQGYRDEAIYWRAIHQIGLYYEQRPNLHRSEWQAIFLFLDKSYDPGLETLGPLYHGDMPWLVRGVVPELLRRVAKPSPVLNVLRPLIAKDEAEVGQQATYWVQEIRQQSDLDQATQERLLILLAQFIIQKFSNLDDKEIEKMLQLTPLEETAAFKGWMRRGQISILAEQIEQKFAIPASLVADSLDSLSTESLKELSRRVLEMETAAQLATWIEEHKPDSD
jgi:predicted transposase YdaD